MTPHDLLLSNDLTDVCDVSSILSKCCVVAADSTAPTASGLVIPMDNTSSPTANTIANSSTSLSKTTCGIRPRSAAFSCRYNISIKKQKTKEGIMSEQKSVILSPYVGNEDVNDARILSPTSSKAVNSTKKRMRIARDDGGHGDVDDEDAFNFPVIGKEDNILQETTMATTTTTNEEEKERVTTIPCSLSSTKDKRKVIRFKYGDTKPDFRYLKCVTSGVTKDYEKPDKLPSTKLMEEHLNIASTTNASEELNSTTINNQNDDSSINTLPSILPTSSENKQDLSNRKRPAPTPTSDGLTTTTMGKIKVGPGYQAIIPHVIKRRKYTPSRPATAVVQSLWKPNTISDTDLHSFLSEAGKVLKKVSDSQGLQLTMMEHRLMLMGRSEQEVTDILSSSSFRAVEYREFNKDGILSLLHECQYDASDALVALAKAPPEKYLTLWTKEEQELYNAGFQTHLNSLLQISKGIKSKSHKDVIDYHYRFKIPDQFRKYERKKLEQAQRMMECIEHRRSDEVMKRLRGSSNDSQIMYTGGGSNGPRKYHEWWVTIESLQILYFYYPCLIPISLTFESMLISLGIRTKTGGGGHDATGATEHRRMRAKKLLLQIQKEVGDKKYRTIVDHLKNFQSHSVTAPQLKEGFVTELGRHPALLEQFQSFLPQPLRNQKTTPE